MATSDLERITAFDHCFARAQATDVVELPWGFALLQSDFPASHQHNRIVVTAGASVDEIVATTDELLGGAGLTHRYVCVDDDALGESLRPDLVASGFEHETIVSMLYAGAEPQSPPHDVRAVTLDVLRPALVRDWRVDLPDSTDDVLLQLADRTALYSRGADTTLLAVFDGDEIAAHASLLIDPVERVAQFENLVTHHDFRGRGYAGSLIRAALRRAQQSDCDVTFLTAELADWPRDWYTRLGFVEVGRTHHFERRT